MNDMYDTLPRSRADLLLSSLVRIATRTTSLATLLGLALSATASDRKPNEAHSKISVKHWFETGTASWYGHRFQGRTTANGEPFDMNRLTCAHRSLPLGSWLRVTNVLNHKAIFVRVNDRGPYVGNRIIDLSFAAANAVGLSGTGQVKLEPVRAGDTELARALVAQLQIPNFLPQD